MEKEMLKGKVAIVTGSSYGMGQAMAELFAKEGAAVVCTARGKEKLDAVVNKINADGGKAIGVVADSSVDADVDRVFEETKKHFGTLDILVNNAGIGEMTPIDELETDWAREVFNINVFGPMRYIKNALEIFMPKNEGAIVVISSVNGTRPINGAAYTASKGAINTLVKNVAIRCVDTNIRCNAIAPGCTITPAYYAVDEGKQVGGTTMIPFGRRYVYYDKVTQPIDQANAALFLCSDMGRCVTGQVLQVCAGGFL